MRGEPGGAEPAGAPASRTDGTGGTPCTPPVLPVALAGAVGLGGAGGVAVSPELSPGGAPVDAEPAGELPPLPVVEVAGGEGVRWRGVGLGWGAGLGFALALELALAALLLDAGT